MPFAAEINPRSEEWVVSSHCGQNPTIVSDPNRSPLRRVTRRLVAVIERQDSHLAAATGFLLSDQCFRVF